MPCEGHVGDYGCTGWRLLAARIRTRDGERCRGCDRGDPDVSLEVHHRNYGHPGQCGECYLTGIADDDLITLCTECHDAITDVRRSARYARRTIEVGLTAAPPSYQQPIRIKTEVTIEMTAAPVTARAVVRRSIFNPFGKE